MVQLLLSLAYAYFRLLVIHLPASSHLKCDHKTAQVVKPKMRLNNEVGRSKIFVVASIRSNVNLNKDINVPGWKATRITIFLNAVLLSPHSNGQQTYREQRFTLCTNILLERRKAAKITKCENPIPISNFIVSRVCLLIPLIIGFIQTAFSVLTANNLCPLNDWQRGLKRESIDIIKRIFSNAYWRWSSDASDPHYSILLETFCFTFTTRAFFTSQFLTNMGRKSLNGLPRLLWVVLSMKRRPKCNSNFTHKSGW